MPCFGAVRVAVAVDRAGSGSRRAQDGPEHGRVSCAHLRMLAAVAVRSQRVGQAAHAPLPEQDAALMYDHLSAFNHSVLCERKSCCQEVTAKFCLYDLVCCGFSDT